MAYAGAQSADLEVRGGSLLAAGRNMFERIGLYLAYQGTVRALSAMPAHTLHDLGVTRATIRQRAYEAVYGA